MGAAERGASAFFVVLLLALLLTACAQRGNDTRDQRPGGFYGGFEGGMTRGGGSDM